MIMKTSHLGLGVCLTIVLLAPAHSVADTLEMLFMPGPVIQGHAEYEEECDRCHSSFEKNAQDLLCLDCHDHEPIAADIARGEGFHGRLETINQVRCNRCHTDHKGRDADILGLDPDHFDHGNSDFALRDAHARLDCADCHTPDRKYRETPSACVECHREQDPHAGRLGTDCAECHDQANWERGAAFDHDVTDFPLMGFHAELECGSCHPDQHYERTPDQCVACHGMNDVHGGRFGEDCAKCHSQSEWSARLFEHDTDTRFRLSGRHRDVSCGACHSGRLYDEKPDRKCLSCHRQDDDHAGRNGSECDKCHDATDWTRSRFDHDSDTKFPLRGKHRDTVCQDCHRGAVFTDKLEASCHACHLQNDAHAGQEGDRCQDCHNERAWRADVFFDHDLTRFPLVGLHSVVACEACHVSPEFKDTAASCVDCHESKDTHEGRLGPACANCHNPNDWSLWRFDHDTQTDYPLVGAHEGIQCQLCHRDASQDPEKMANTCYACHQADDAHRGRYGRSCERCHNPESFREISVGTGGPIAAHSRVKAHPPGAAAEPNPD